MKISLKFAVITMLATFETVLIIVSDDWYPLWLTIGFVMIALVTTPARAVPRVPVTRSRKIACCAVWALCASGMVYELISLKHNREEGGFIWPHALVEKLETQRFSYHHYPATRAEVVVLDGSHKLISYHSDGQRYDFTIGIGNFFPRLWAYDSETQQWTRERD